MFLLETFSLIAAFVFAISAAVQAIKKRFDLFGIALIAFVTSVGGGTIRDIMLGHFPITWLKNPSHSYAILAGLIVSFLFTEKLHKLRKTFFWFDTIGIGVTTIIGIHKGLDAGLDSVLTIFFGVISAIFGGIIRDILCNEVPLILRKEIYATACIIGGGVYVLLYELNVEPIISITSSVLLIIFIRYYSIKNKLKLPILSYRLKQIK